MVLRTVRIGSMIDIHQYDDADFTYAIDTDGAIRAASIDPAGATATFDIVAAIQPGGAGSIGFQYRTRQLTVSHGIISTVGALSTWVDV